MKTIKSTYTFIVASMFLILVSCSDIVNYDKDWDSGVNSYGPPTITRIAASTDLENPITEGSLNQVIAIIGDNLTDLESIQINDIDVDLKQVYAVRTRINLQIPRVLPGEVDNKIKIKTKRGSTEANIKIVLPQFKVEGFYNDFALDGDTVRVLGSDFDLYKINNEDAVVKMNGEKLEIIKADDHSFGVKIPIGTPQNSVMTIESPELSGPFSVKFREMGVPILTDYNAAWNGPWYPHGFVAVQPDSEPFSPWTYYVWIKATYPGGGWAWDNYTITHFELKSNNPTHVDLLTNPQDYVLKFEIFTDPTRPMPRYFQIGTNGTFFGWDPATTNDGVSLNTNWEWKTITLPFSSIFPAKPEGYLGKTNLNLDQDIPFQIANNTNEAIDVSFGYWNFRAVKKAGL